MTESDFSPACVECGSTEQFVTDYQSGHYICSVCGIVQPERVIDEGKEWREFDNGDNETVDRSRADKADEDFNSLGTYIAPTDYGSSIQSQGAKTLSRYHQLANALSTDRREKYLKEAFSKMHELAEKLQLPNIIKSHAKEILKRFEKQRGQHAKGFRKDAFIVAILLFASKQQQGGCTLKAIASTTRIEEREIKRFYKILLRDTSLQALNDPSDRRTASHEVQDLVGVYCNRLKEDYAIVKEAKEVAKQAISFLEGKRPSSVAAASIMFVLTMRNHQAKNQELATVAGVSSNTIRTVMKQLVQHIDHLPIFASSVPFSFASETDNIAY